MTSATSVCPPGLVGVVVLQTAEAGVRAGSAQVPARKGSRLGCDPDLALEGDTQITFTPGPGSRATEADLASC